MRKSAVLAALFLLVAAVAMAQANPSSPGATPANPSAQQPSYPNPDTQNAPPANTSVPGQEQPPRPVMPQDTIRQDEGHPTDPVLTGRNGREAAGPREISAGTEIKASLDQPLSTKNSRVGQQFTATVIEPVRGANGNVLVPPGSKIHGEVTQAEQGKVLASIRGKGALNLRFHNVVLPGGQSIPITATLQSVHGKAGGSSVKGNEEGQVTGGTSGGQVAKDVGIGAAAGTVAGLIFGSALKGLAVGAIAGGGYVAATGGREVSLPAQTGLVLRVDHPVSVQR
jgi:hypothetical protein